MGVEGCEELIWFVKDVLVGVAGKACFYAERKVSWKRVWMWMGGIYLVEKTAALAQRQSRRREKWVEWSEKS